MSAELIVVAAVILAWNFLPSVEAFNKIMWGARVNMRAVAFGILGLIWLTAVRADALDDFARDAAVAKGLQPPQRIDSALKKAFVSRWGRNGELFITVMADDIYVEHPQRDIGRPYRVGKSRYRFELCFDDPCSDEYMSIVMIEGRPYLLSHEEPLIPLTKTIKPTVQWRK
jgi:hypothetical protein